MWRRSKTAQEINLLYDTKVSQAITDLATRYSDFCKKEIQGVQAKRERKKDKAIQKRVKMLDRQRNNDLVKRGHMDGKILKHKMSDSAKKKKLLRIIQKYVVYRDTNKEWFGNCIYCTCLLHISKAIDGKSANWCHCITSVRNATAFEPDNINLWCNWCNKADACGNMESKDSYRKNIDIKHWVWTYDRLFKQAKKSLRINKIKEIYGRDIDELLIYRKKKMEKIKKTKAQ